MVIFKHGLNLCCVSVFSRHTNKGSKASMGKALLGMMLCVKQNCIVRKPQCASYSHLSGYFFSLRACDRHAPGFIGTADLITT